ncbi:hypothetical protein C8J56DRAFT_889389 [Mycena floridula]|nr:hypothetical protein C8J56DRAFT_889389 [Mycena floridula]
MDFKRGLKTRWATSIILFYLYCLEQLPFNGVDNIADEVLSPGLTLLHANDAPMGWSFSDHTVDIQRTRCMVQCMLLYYRVTTSVKISSQTVSAPPATSSGLFRLSVTPHDNEMPPFVDWDMDHASEPSDSASGSDTDSDMPPLIDLYDSNSGYGSNQIIYDGFPNLAHIQQMIPMGGTHNQSLTGFIGHWEPADRISSMIRFMSEYSCPVFPEGCTFQWQAQICPKRETASENFLPTIDSTKAKKKMLSLRRYRAQTQ